MKHKGVCPISLSTLEKPIPSTLEKRIHSESATMTPKSRQIATYVMKNPQKAVFMTTRQLASAAEVSEATVVRFVRQLGYQSYAVFIRQLRDHIDSSLTLMDRSQIAKSARENHQTPLSRVVAEEIENLSMLLNHIDMEVAEKVVDALYHAHRIIVVGSRLSYSLACYLGWTLTKVRTDILIRSGSDRSTIDWMAIAPKNTVVVVVAMSPLSQRADPYRQDGATSGPRSCCPCRQHRLPPDSVQHPMPWWPHCNPFPFWAVSPL